MGVCSSNKEVSIQEKFFFVKIEELAKLIENQSEKLYKNNEKFIVNIEHVVYKVEKIEGKDKNEKEETEKEKEEVVETKIQTKKSTKVKLPSAKKIFQKIQNNKEKTHQIILKINPDEEEENEDKVSEESEVSIAKINNMVLINKKKFLNDIINHSTSNFSLKSKSFNKHSTSKKFFSLKEDINEYEDQLNGKTKKDKADENESSKENKLNKPNSPQKDKKIKGQSKF